MGVTVAEAPPIPEILVRDQFSYTKLFFLSAIHLGALAAFWQTTWGAIGAAIALHAMAGGLGVCVGYHRLLTHRSFKCPKIVEYAFALLGSLSIEGGPIDWVAHHRQHHQFPDQPGDPHSARSGFWWSHLFWMMWTPSEKDWGPVTQRYVPDLLRVPFYRFLGRMYIPLSVALGIVLYLLGGWPWVVWGMFVRLVWTYHSTWLVNSASHKFGYQTYETEDLSSNCWWVALMSYGEGWHNNHHAFPTSARHGLRWWEFDASYWFIRGLEMVHLASDLRLPSSQQMEVARKKAA